MRGDEQYDIRFGVAPPVGVLRHTGFRIGRLFVHDGGGSSMNIIAVKFWCNLWFRLRVVRVVRVLAFTICYHARRNISKYMQFI